MGLWVLEPRSGEAVPGTVHIGRDTEEQAKKTAHLKHGSGRNSKLVLSPQPSNSPNDPLNWSETTKIFHSLLLTIGTGLVAGTHNFLNPSVALMAKDLNTTVTNVSRSVSFVLLALGISAIVSSPLARMWGKRPIFLIWNFFSTLGYVIVICKPNSIKALYAGRAIHGFGISALEYLVSSSVGDLFYVHQRGIHLSLWHFGLAGGNSIGQVIASAIVDRQGWVWPFRYVVIALVVYTVALFFFLPETTYIRPAHFDTDIHETLPENVDIYSEKSPGFQGIKTEAIMSPSDRSSDSSEVIEKKKSYVQSLKIFNGRFSEDSYLTGLKSSFSTFLLPGVAWAAFSYSCSVAFAITFSISLSQIFKAPPYNFKTKQIGLTVLSSFIGTILGNCIPGPVADWLVKFMSRKNNGVYEPEFRNLLCIPSLIFGLMGFWGFGLSLDAKSPWIVPVFFMGLSTFAGSILSLVSNTYLLDCHRAQAQDSYAAVTLVKGIFAFAMAFVVNDWITKSGVSSVFFVVGALHGFACVIGLFLYVFGKRIRLKVSKSNFIQRNLGGQYKK